MSCTGVSVCTPRDLYATGTLNAEAMLIGANSFDGGAVARYPEAAGTAAFPNTTQLFTDQLRKTYVPDALAPARDWRKVLAQYVCLISVSFPCFTKWRKTLDLRCIFAIGSQHLVGDGSQRFQPKHVSNPGSVIKKCKPYSQYSLRVLVFALRSITYQLESPSTGLFYSIL